MKICALCKKTIEVDNFFSRKASCPECGADLHICLNCRFYSESSHNKCLEPKAEFQRTRDKANFCDYFSFREDPRQRKKGSANSAISEETAKARKKFDDLFKNNLPC